MSIRLWTPRNWKKIYPNSIRKRRQLSPSKKFEDAASIRDKERTLKEKIDVLKTNWKNEKASRIPTIDASKIAEIVAKLTGVPVQQMEEGGKQKTSPYGKRSRKKSLSGKAKQWKSSPVLSAVHAPT